MQKKIDNVALNDLLPAVNNPVRMSPYEVIDLIAEYYGAIWVTDTDGNIHITNKKDKEESK